MVVEPMKVTLPDGSVQEGYFLDNALNAKSNKAKERMEFWGMFIGIGTGLISLVVFFRHH